MAKSATKSTTTRSEPSREAEARTPARVPAEAQSAPAAARDTRLPATARPLPVIVPIGQHVEAHRADLAGTGMEQLRPEDIIRPRLKLIQGISPEIQVYDDLRAGHFFHTGQKAILDKPFVGVPLAFDIRYILWNPRGQGGGILARADDGKHWDPPDVEFTVKLDVKDGGHTVTWKTARTVSESGLDRFGTYNPNIQGSPPAATISYNFLLGFPFEEELEPAVLSFQRSATTSGKEFNKQLLQAIKKGGLCMYQCAFLFESVLAHNKRNEAFQNIQVTPNGSIPKQDPILAEYEQWFLAYRRSKVKIGDMESMHEEGEGVTVEGNAQSEGALAY